MHTRTPLTLDHVALVVNDLDQASETYARMGFQLSPRSTHKGALVAGGPVVGWGTGNHCAMFEAGYLEILGITDKNRHKEHVQVLLDQYEGLHLIALGCANAAQEAQEIRRRLGRGEEPYTLGRDVPMTDGGSKAAQFDILQLPDDVFPEADLFLIEHRNRDVLWQPDMLPQENGVLGLSEIVVCSEDTDASASRLSEALGITPDNYDASLLFSFAQGALRLVTVETLRTYYADVKPAKLPWVAVVEFVVADIGVTRSFLQQNRFMVRESGAGYIWLDPEQAQGAIVRFTQAE